MADTLFKDLDESASVLLPERPPTRDGLTAPATLLPQMAEIRGHIAGNAAGVTRDETIVTELAKILHAKTYDEILLRRRRTCKFYYLRGERPSSVRERIQRLLDDATAGAQRDLGGPRGSDFTIALDDDSVAYAVGVLQQYAILAAERDILGEAFESLIGPSLRGAEGQFFTPRNLTQMCVTMVDPVPGESVIDPACGTGGFLGDALRHMSLNRSRKRSRVIGIDKDSFLAALCHDHLALYQRSHSVFCENSLDRPTTWSTRCQENAALGTFDVVLTNPPFGAAIPVRGSRLLTQYELARKWIKTATGRFAQTDASVESRPPQILFIERCIRFLKPGGRAAIVLPEGILGNESEGYIRQWILEQAAVEAIVDCPLETFLPSTPTKTCVLFLRKHEARRREPTQIFVAVAERCGHDRRGKPSLDEAGQRIDDFPLIAAEYRSQLESQA